MNSCPKRSWAAVAGTNTRSSTSTPRCRPLVLEDADHAKSSVGHAHGFAERILVSKELTDHGSTENDDTPTSVHVLLPNEAADVDVRMFRRSPKLAPTPKTIVSRWRAWWRIEPPPCTTGDRLRRREAGRSSARTSSMVNGFEEPACGRENLRASPCARA